MPRPIRNLSRRSLLAGALAGTAAMTGCTGDQQPGPTPPSVPTPAGDPTQIAPSASALPAGTKVEIDFWTGFTGGDGPTMGRLVNRFNAEHPDITVRYSAREWTRLYPELAAETLAGRGPGVAAVQVSQVATLAARRLLQPLAELVERQGYRGAAFAGGAWQAGVYRDQRYAIPLDVHPLGCFTNSALLRRAGLDPARPPTDRAGLEAALAACKQQGVTGQQAIAATVPGGFAAQSLLMQFGGLVLSPDTLEVGWAGEAGLKALTWCRDLIDLGFSRQPAADDDGLTDFVDGRVAFRWSGGWEISRYLERPGLQWQAASLPNVGGTAAAWAGSHQLVLPGTTSEPNRAAAAGTFIAWLLEHSIDWAKAGQVPALNSVRDSAEFKALGAPATLASGLEQVRFDPAVPGFGEVMNQWYRAVSDVVTGRLDPKTALNEAGARAQTILDQNRKRFG